MTEQDDLRPEGWPAPWARALSDSMLRVLCRKAVFQRGQAYAASGAVNVASEDPLPDPAISARVTGSNIYTTDLWIEEDGLAGSCDCANAMDGSFCKHQVALALVWRERLAGKEPVTSAPAGDPVLTNSRRARPPKDARRALHDFLHGLPTSVLANKLLEIADQDHDIARELQQWRKVSELTDEPTDLKPIVSEILTPGHGFISWNETSSYVRRAEAVLPLLRQARSRDAGGAVALCVQALRHGWAVLAQADDSNGEIGELCQSIGVEVVLSLQAAAPQPAAFGDTYLQLQLEDPFDCVDAKAAEAAMGDAALIRYRSALEARWRHAKDSVLALKAEHAAKVAVKKGRPPIYERSSEQETRLWTLERLHLAQLGAMGRTEAALAVFREDLFSAQAHAEVVHYLEAHGRFAEALTQAEQGSKAFPDDWRVQEDLLRCYERDDRVQEALAIRRQLFDRLPGVERYKQVLAAGQAADVDVTALRQSLLDELKAREEDALRAPPRAGGFAMPRNAPAPAARDVTLRAEILCAEGLWVEACALVQPPSVCRDSVLRRMATHLPDEQQEHALKLLLRVFDNDMRKSASPYDSEIALVKEIAKRMHDAQRAAWLTHLRVEYKAKRNFVRDLPQH